MAIPNVFTYGTLRPAQCNQALLAGRGARSARADGLALYVPHHNAFPYAAPEPGGTVHGTLYRLPRDPAPLLARLDFLEGYSPDRPSECHYTRVLRTVTVEDGTECDAWMYLAGPLVDVTRMRRLPGGVWTSERV